MTAKQFRKRVEKLEEKQMSAIVSTGRMDVSSQQDSASTSMSAKNASKVDMEKWSAKSMRQCEELGKRPRYLRHNVYRDDDLSSCTCAEWTEIASPLASIPNSELVNDLANETIKNYSHLFEVHTPINVERFEHLLQNHPNPLFVNSVVDGF